MSFYDVKEGEHSDEINATPERVILASDQLLIFLDSGTLRICINSSEDYVWPDGYTSIRVRMSALDSLPTHDLSAEQRLEFQTKIAQGLAHFLDDGVVEDAHAMFDQAREYYESAAVQVTRRWRLLTSLSAMVVCLLAALVVVLATDGQGEWRYVAASLLGSVGVFVSVAQRLSKQRTDPAVGLQLHIVEMIARIVVGVIGAYLAFAAIRGELALSVLDPMLENTPGLVLIAVAAGASERLVPQMLKQVGIDRDSAAAEDEGAED